MPAKKGTRPAMIKVEPKITPAQTSSPMAVAENPQPPVAQFYSQIISSQDEKTWSMLAHLSVLVNLVTGLGGPIAALIIYLVYKDRSRLVAYHALQAMIFQLIWWYGGGLLIGLMWAIVGILSSIVIGVVLVPAALCMTPLLAVLPVGALIYGVIAAIQTNQGNDFKYWLVGDWVRGTLNGS
jgi:uncharacterized protein